MTKIKEIYKCTVCGNIVGVLRASVGELVCCGQPMEPQRENTVDAATEKHAPVIEKLSDGYLIKIGELAHPMEDAHYIEWIEVEVGNTTSRRWLNPGEDPSLKIETKETITLARAYCNLHGLWTSKK